VLELSLIHEDCFPPFSKNVSTHEVAEPTGRPPFRNGQVPLRQIICYAQDLIPERVGDASTTGEMRISSIWPSR